jgi:hypothetical protein
MDSSPPTIFRWFESVRYLVRGSTRLTGLGVLVIVLLTQPFAKNVRGATSENAQSPVGMNLQNVNYYSPEQPFIDIFKTSGVAQGSTSGWITHNTQTNSWDTGEEAYLQLDANGYPTTLAASADDPHSPQLFNSVALLVLKGLPNSNGGRGLPYPAGQYVVRYDGQGTLDVGFDAALASSEPGRLVFNVARPTTNGGVVIYITSTDPLHTGNYLRNIRIVKADQEALLLGGNVFNPVFLRLLQNFRVLRAMQWMEIDGGGGLLTDWSQRPLPTDGGWGGSRGVPLEIVLQVCNAVGADCWLNVPHMATNDYITQMATLAHAKLGTAQQVYIEYSNEVWNSDFAQYAYAAARGHALWPNGGSDFTVNQNWYGMRTAQTCDIWKSVWGADASRVICVASAQAANARTDTQALSCPLWIGAGHAPCSSHGIGAVAIAPYFSVSGQTSWLSAADGGLSSLFSSIEKSALPIASSWEGAYEVALAPYGLPLIAYESGQSLVGHPTYKSGSAMVNLYIAANRDPRMASAYTTMLNDWKSHRGQIIVIYADIAAPGQYGEWGALESLLDTVNPLSSAPPKWQAIQNFISKNKCWWPGCVGAIRGTN